MVCGIEAIYMGDHTGWIVIGYEIGLFTCSSGGDGVSFVYPRRGFLKKEPWENRTGGGCGSRAPRLRDILFSSTCFGNTCILFVFLMYSRTRSLYYSEYEFLTGEPKQRSPSF